jgi:hypothetical protein
MDSMESKDIIMECKLCLKERKLCKSHIIPEFFYHSLYDLGAHRFHYLSAEGSYSKTKQKGLYERLLCDDCEKRLNKYETYVSKIFNGQVSVEPRKDGRLVHLSGVMYKEFKLLGMSILWRAGISQLPMFSKVQLGPHQEKIRQMIYEDNPGTFDQYGFILSPISSKKYKTDALIFQPTPSRLEGSRCYRFVFGGIIWGFVVSSNGVSNLIKDSFLNEKGEIRMLPADMESVPFIMGGMKGVSENAPSNQPLK